jgi:hypothetical protein
VGGGTFDGRDLFAPVAARLWLGASLHDVGIPIDPAGLARLAAPRLLVVPAGGTAPAAGETHPAGGTDLAGGTAPAGSVEAEVLWIDGFGNVQLAGGADDASRAGLDGGVVIESGTAGDGTAGDGTAGDGTAGDGTAGGGPARRGRRVGSFEALDGDELGLLIDGNGHLALVCNRRAAATVLGVRAGDIVRLRPTS